MDAALDSVVRSENMELRSVQFSTELEKRDLGDERTRRAWLVGIVVSLVVGVVSYYVTNIWGMSARYPKLFAWYAAMRKERPQGLGTHDFSLYQVATAANFAAAQSMLNLMLIWKDLHPAAAQFLLYTVQYFDTRARADPTQRLTALHWAGSRAQTRYDKLLGPTGWASTGCGGTSTLEQKKETLVANWNSGRGENIWYDLLPKPLDSSSKRAFLSVPMIAELYSDSASTGGAASACDAAAFATSKIARLYDGGLCNVAFEATRSDQSAAALFNEFFATHDDPTASQSCAGAARAGAVSGGLSGAMSGAMLMQLIPVPGFKAVSAIALKGAAMLATAAGGAAAGGITSANAARSRCTRSDE